MLLWFQLPRGGDRCFLCPDDSAVVHQRAWLCAWLDIPFWEVSNVGTQLGCWLSSVLYIDSASTIYFCGFMHLWVFSFSGKATELMPQYQSFWASSFSSFLPGDPSLPPATEAQVSTNHNRYNFSTTVLKMFGVSYWVKGVNEAAQHHSSITIIIPIKQLKLLESYLKANICCFSFSLCCDLLPGSPENSVRKSLERKTLWFEML